MSMSELKESEINALRRVCECLFIQVPEHVAQDVKTKAEAVIALAQCSHRAAVTGPRGETDTAYNLGEITELQKEIIGSVERERLQKASPWVRSLVNELVQRIYNLRRIAQAATTTTTSCDYRKNECSAEGVTIGGKWICNNHAATSSPTSADHFPVSPAHDDYGVKEDGSMTKNYDDFRAGMLRAAEMCRSEFRRAPEAAKGHDCVYMGGYEDACDHLSAAIAQAAVIDSVRIAGQQPDWQYHISLLLPDGIEDVTVLKIYQVVEHELRVATAPAESTRVEGEQCKCGHSRWDHWGWGNFACVHGDCAKFTAVPADNDAELLLQHVAYSGVEFDDNRMGYVVVQIDRDVWEQIKKLAPTTTKGDR